MKHYNFVLLNNKLQIVYRCSFLEFLFTYDGLTKLIDMCITFTDWYIKTHFKKRKDLEEPRKVTTLVSLVRLHLDLILDQEIQEFWPLYGS